MSFVLPPPIEPMLAKLADELPPAAASSTSRSGTASARSSFAAAPSCSSRAAISSRSIATFPSCTTRCSTQLPDGCVVDGEIVIATPRGLDFDALQMRLHPGRVARREARGGDAGVVRRVRLCSRSTVGICGTRRSANAARCSSARWPASSRPMHLTPVTRDRERGAPTGSRASRAPGSTASSPSRQTALYEPGKRAMIKIKHARTADCVVAGFRWHKDGQGRASRIAAARAVRRSRAAAPRRRDLVVHDGDAGRSSSPSWRRCASARSTSIRGASGPSAMSQATDRMPGGQSRWSAGKDLSWEPLRIERVCEVKYDHMQGDRFRHAAVVPALAAGQAAAGLPLRSARGHDSGLRAREGLSTSRPASGSEARPVLTVGSPPRIAPSLRRSSRDRALPAPAAAPPARAAG